MKRFFSALPLLLLLCFSAYGQNPWTGIISSSRAIDWRNAGVTGGIPNRTTICATMSPVGTQAVPVAPTAINAAIQACTNGVVLLSAGDYYLNTSINFNSTGPHDNVTVRGAGGDQTKIHFIGGGEVHLAAWSSSGGTANWTGGYSQGATSITLDNVSGITVNQSPIFLRQCDDGYSGNPCVAGASGGSLDNGQIFACTNDAHYCANQGTGGGNSQVQVVLATAISGSGPFTVTIDRPLYASNWRAGQSPTAQWVTRPLANSGLEDVSVDVSGGSNNPVGMNTTLNCWIKGVRMIGGNTKDLDVFFSPRASIINNYVTTFVGAALAYPISLDNSGDVLELNNIFTYAGGPIIDEPEAGDVIAFNYVRDYWGQLNGGTAQNWYDDHAAGFQFSLLEGNQLGMVNEDAIHGTHDFQTIFRNQFNSQDNPYLAATGNTSAIFLRWGVRYANVVGNVLGAPSWSNQYECTAPSCVTATKTIYTLGTSAGPPFADPLVKNTLFRWGNYDAVNAAVQWNSAEVPSALNAGAGFSLALTGSGVGPWTGTIANTPCINQLNVVKGSTGVFGYDIVSAAGAGLTGAISGTGIVAGSVNCTTGAVTVTFSASQTSARINYVQQTASASAFRNPIPASHTLPNSFFLTANSSTSGGTGLSWWKVCTNYPTCSTFQTQPFPLVGPDVTGGNGAGGFAYDTPAAIAWRTLPVDPAFQTSYVVTGATWSAGVATITVSGMGSNRFIGEFTLSGMTPSGYNGTYLMTGSNLTTVSYALAVNPGAFSSGGTMKFPNVRVFNETVYRNDPAGSAPSLSFSPSPANFGSQNVGTTGAPVTVTVTNIGTASQVMATPFFTITGTNAANFANAGTGTCTNGGTITASASCTVNLTFTPSATGARTATLTIQGTVFASDTLNGTGTGPALSLSPSPGAFSGQNVGTTSSPLTITVSNTGTGTETLSNPFFTVTGTNAADFARSGGTCSNAGTIAASASCTILLTFTPSAAGARSANLNILGTVNALDSLTGTGLQAALTITPSPGAFGNQNVNSTSGPLTITVTNSGTASEVLSTPYFTLTGTNANNFANAGTGSCANGGTIAASNSCTVNLTFTPSASGSRTATLNISGTVNGSDSLTGTGIAAFASLSPLSIAFASQTTNTSSGNNAVTLTNTGTATLTISSISLTGANAGEFSTNGSTCGASLAAAASCSLNVVFSPTTVGSKSASLVFVTNAASSPDSVALTGTGVAPAVPVINLSPNPVPFGSQLQNTTSAGITVTVSNSGTASEVLSTPFFTLTGTNVGDFARSGGTCVNGATIAVSGSCTVILTFTPTATGSRSAIFNINGTVTASDALSGTGTLPVIGLSPSPAAFGSQLQGTTSGGLTVTVSNTGTATEVLSTPFFTITGTNPTNFARSGGTCLNGGSIAASSSCTIILTFTPSATGARTATLTIQGTVNASDSLTGTGTQPVLALAPSPAAFGNQNVSSTSSPLTVTVTNTGTGSQTLATPFFTITGANAADYARSGGTCANAGTIAASGSCTILLTFTPGASGSRTATLNISGTVSGTDSLTGTGVAPILSLAPSPGAFGNQNVGTTSSPLTITVSNVGTATETLNTPYFTLTGTNSANFANAGTGTCANGGTIAASASCTVDLTFTPSASGSRVATLTISGTVNGVDSLTGTGVAPGVLLSPTSIAFGNQTVNTSSGNHAVTLTNNGTSTLTISSIALTGANSAEFSTNGSTCAGMLAAAASCSLNVVFTPTTAASKTASLTFTTDAASSPDNVSLTGTGIVPAVPVLGFSPTPGAFGNQLQNTTSSGITFTVSNSGTAAETLATPFFTITGANSTNFARSGGTCANAGSIAVSGSCTITLTFTPSSTGSRTGTLNISGTVNASNALTGTGTLPVLSFSPTPVVFGNQTQGTTSPVTTLTVSNTGTADEILQTPYFSFSGTNATSFAVAVGGTCANGATIAASDSCTVFLTFTPATTGSLTANVNILGTVNNSNALSGTSSTSAVTLNPASINYGNQDDGTSSPPTSVTLTNGGSGVLTITSIALTGTNASEFSINTNTCGTTLAASASCTWNVVFSPATAGSKTAAVTITSNALTSPDALNLTGTGRVPTPPSTPAPAIIIVTILPPGSVVVGSGSSGISPRNVLASSSGCSQDGIVYSNPCKFSISCGNCGPKTNIFFNGTKVSQTYFKGTITAAVPVALIPTPNIATDYSFSLLN